MDKKIYCINCRHLKYIKTLNDNRCGHPELLVDNPIYPVAEEDRCQKSNCQNNCGFYSPTIFFVIKSIYTKIRNKIDGIV